MKINGNNDGGGRAPVVESLYVTSNGNYSPASGVDGFDLVDVEVNPLLQTKSVTVNGTVAADDGYYGLAAVDVNVPQSVTGYTEKDLTERTFTLINLNNSASFVASTAFQGNTTLQTVNLPNCKVVNWCGFQNCSSLTTVSLPVCSSISTYVFSGCKSLSNLYIPVCSSIGDYALAYTALVSVDLPNISVIRPNLLTNCSKLLTFKAENVVVTGGYVFSNCYSLQSVSLPKLEFMDQAWYMFSGCSNLTEVNLPLLVNLHAMGMFSTCISLQSVSLPKLMWWSDNSCFYRCSNLRELTLCTDTYFIPSYNANLLYSTPLVNGEGSIYVDAGIYDKWITTTGWSSLSKRFVSVGNSDPMLSFSDGLVYGKTKLINYGYLSYLGISKNDVTALSLTEISGVNKYNRNYQGYSSYITLSLYSYPNLQSVNLPSCDYIGYEAFGLCSSLQTVSIPACEYISASAFRGCRNLQSVNFPVCSYIGSYAFQNCYSLQTVSIPVCSYVGLSAFQKCSSLQSVNLPVCSYIGSYAFCDCSSLQTVNLPVCKYIENETFQSCYSLQTVSLPACKVIKYEAFRNCSSLQSIDLPACEYISASAFVFCYSLQTVNLPVCSFINERAFSSCESLYSVTLGSSSVCRIYERYAFLNTAPSLSIYVPASLVDAYKSATNWVYMSSRIFPISE